MKQLCVLVLVSVLTTITTADDLAASFKQAAALAAQENGPAVAVYEHEAGAYYQRKYWPVFQACLKSTDNADKSPFSFVIVIGKDGHVLRLYVDHETNIYACVRETLQKETFPPPPFAPYYTFISMSFE